MKYYFNPQVALTYLHLYMPVDSFPATLKLIGYDVLNKGSGVRKHKHTGQNKQMDFP